MKKATSMPTKQDSFANNLKNLIQQANLTAEPESVGTIVKYGDGVVEVKGLSKAQLGELIDLGKNEFGLALNLKKDIVGIVTLGDARHISSGQISASHRQNSLDWRK
jgi:F0F1-type ATP synthase alpha subunit